MERARKRVARSTVEAVYAQVISDLTEAESLLAADDIWAPKAAAQAYLMRVYFQMGNYAKAAEYAQKVIDSNLNLGESFTLSARENPFPGPR